MTHPRLHRLWKPSRNRRGCRVPAAESYKIKAVKAPRSAGTHVPLLALRKWPSAAGAAPACQAPGLGELERDEPGRKYQRYLTGGTIFSKVNTPRQPTAPTNTQCPSH